MRTGFIIFCLLTGLHAFSQQQKYFVIDPLLPKRSEQDTIIPYLVTHDRIGDAYFGYVGNRCLNFNKFEYYAAHYPIDSLLTFIAEDAMISLKVYSFWALVRRNYTRLEEVGANIFRDTSTLTFFSGCLIDKYAVNQFAYELLAGNIDRTCEKWPAQKLIAIRKKYNIKPVYKDTF